jgi:sirohydrochlorin ferrochelatase
LSNPRVDSDKLAVILVDHGSTVEESNRQLDDIVEAYRRHSGRKIVEPAHMELAEPSLAAAFRRCVAQGAELVVVMPYFLGPGKHSSQDIPRLVAEAGQACGGVNHLVTAPLGLHELVLRVVDERIAKALASSAPC